MIFAGKLCVWCFSAGCSSILLYAVLISFLSTHDLLTNGFLVSHYIILNLLIKVLLKGFEYQVAVRGCMLGSAFAAGVFISCYANETISIFGWYLCALTFFHFSEFVAISICNPDTLDINSFVLNHSRDYKIAAVASWVEFFIESYFFPSMKTLRLVPFVGMLWCVSGEFLRKSAMLTASKSFTHTVVSRKEKHHVLVTRGVYSLFRHPSYVGWFYWAVGTQLILVNPFCILAYGLASWKFFNERITVEEMTLLNFFGNEYADYQKQVPIGLPFIRGYILEE